MLKSELLEFILSTSGPEHLDPRQENAQIGTPVTNFIDSQTPENTQIGPLGYYFVDFWTQSWKILKSELLERILLTSGLDAKRCSNQTELLKPILSISGAKAGEYLNKSSWKPCCPLLDPAPKKPEIGAPGTHHLDDFGNIARLT